jgi:nitrogen fixation protein NifZ
MGLGKEEEIEVYQQPKFMPGTKVRSIKYVKNDGTYAGKDVGEVLVAKNDWGYVRDVGMYLQRYYIYATEFVERGTVVGMRGRELRAFDEPAKAKAPAEAE